MNHGPDARLHDAVFVDITDQRVSLLEGAFTDLLSKRMDQLEKGYDAAHDDAHGPDKRQFSLAGLAATAAQDAVTLGKDGMNAEQAATYRKKILSAASYLLADLDRHDRATSRGDFPEKMNNGLK